MVWRAEDPQGYEADKAVRVYALSSTEDGEIRYVGQTTKPLSERLKEHRAHAKRYRHRHLSCWILAVYERGHKVTISVLDEDAVWNYTEREQIALMRERGIRLVNATGGGEGRARVDWTVEMRAKVSRKMKGRPKSDAHKRALSDALKGRSLSDDHKASVSRALKGRTPKNLPLLHEARRKAALMVLGDSHAVVM